MNGAVRGHSPRVHVVTDDAVLARDDFLARATEVSAAGADRIALHLRGPRTSGAELYRLATELVDITESWRTPLLVNDRVDVALACGAAGVHLGRRSLPVADARSLLAAGAVVGVSTHGPADVSEAVADGADHLFVGTIFPTPSHEGVPGIGASGLREALRHADGVPTLGIGGITPARVGELLETGAHGVAVLRGVWDAPAPADAIRAYVNAIEDAIG